MHINRHTATWSLCLFLLWPAQAQTPAPPPARVVQGTTQLTGAEGALGKTFTVGKGSEAINFTLTGAEFSVTRVTIGEHVYVPTASEKLLILHYTVHNPQKVDRAYAWNTLKFTAVDAFNANHVHDNYVGQGGTTNVLDITLKPAQKVQAYAVMSVPAAGPIPKLIVSTQDAQGVVRYDLRGQVKALPSPFADPKDAARVSALEAVPMSAGAYAPLGLFDVKLDALAFADTVKGERLAEGERALMATFTVRNGTGRTASPQAWAWNTFKIQLRDADGEVTVYDDDLLKVARDETTEGVLKPGEEARFRVYFQLPAGVKPVSVQVTEGDSRAAVYDAGQVK